MPLHLIERDITKMQVDAIVRGRKTLLWIPRPFGFCGRTARRSTPIATAFPPAEIKCWSAWTAPSASFPPATSNPKAFPEVRLRRTSACPQGKHH